jgi:hypothetical protein
VIFNAPYGYFAPPARPTATAKESGVEIITPPKINANPVVSAIGLATHERGESERVGEQDESGDANADARTENNGVDQEPHK